MQDQPLSEIKATVFKQFSLKWQEVGKSAVIAGATITVGMLYVIINDQRWPTTPELIAALKAGLFAIIGALSRYFLNPTTTVIKGQADPTSKVITPATVVTKDEK